MTSVVRVVTAQVTSVSTTVDYLYKVPHTAVLELGTYEVKGQPLLRSRGELMLRVLQIMMI